MGKALQDIAGALDTLASFIDGQERINGKKY